MYDWIERSLSREAAKTHLTRVFFFFFTWTYKKNKNKKTTIIFWDDFLGFETNADTKWYTSRKDARFSPIRVLEPFVLPCCGDMLFVTQTLTWVQHLQHIMSRFLNQDLWVKSWDRHRSAWSANSQMNWPFLSSQSTVFRKCPCQAFA